MKVVTYYRVSTAKQGQSGLGLEAQQYAVGSLCKGRGWEIIEEFTEVESGKNDARPQLKAALLQAKVTGATLVVAKLDRLSRNLAFLATMMESKVKFIAADMPEANEMTVGIMAVVAQAERKAISTRTKEALAAAKARGVKLGNPNGAAALRRAQAGNSSSVAARKALAEAYAADVAPVVEYVQARGKTTLRAIASELNARHVKTRRGGQWRPSTVASLLKRMPA